MNWINVKYRLPSENEANNNLILVWCKEYDDEYYQLVDFDFENKKFEFIFNGGEYITDYTDVVTHWCISTKPN